MLVPWHFLFDLEPSKGLLGPTVPAQTCCSSCTGPQDTPSAQPAPRGSLFRPSPWHSSGAWMGGGFTSEPRSTEAGAGAGKELSRPVPSKISRCGSTEAAGNMWLCRAFLSGCLHPDTLNPPAGPNETTLACLNPLGVSSPSMSPQGDSPFLTPTCQLLRHSTRPRGRFI